MHRFPFAFVLCGLLSFTTHAATYHVSPNGADVNPGTEALPFLTVAKGVSVASPGDVVYLRGGTYANTNTVTISRSGTAVAYCTLMSYPGERALLDFTGQAFGKRGLALTGSYWHLNGIDITKSGDNGMYISGAYNKIEFCSFYDNQDSGLQLSGGAHHNQIINCDSYWNADPTDYGDADGFAVKMDVGTGNYFYGCRAWLNVDDGWDGYMRGADDVSTVLENCWTWKNGYFKDGTDAGANANGNGFKVGGSDDKTLKHNFTLRNCLAFDNKAKGFDQNNNKGDMYFYNCTAYRNVGNNFSIPSAIAAGKVAEVKNCVAVDGKISLASFVVQANNGWLSPFVTTTADFVSLDVSQALHPRNADGSLPTITLVHLVAGSDLIDGGQVLSGITYNGTKPDLGAFEYEVTTSLRNGTTLTSTRFAKLYCQSNVLYADVEFFKPFSGYLQVMDMTGRIVVSLPVKSANGNASLVAPLPKANAGMYIARLVQEGTVDVAKFVIK